MSSRSSALGAVALADARASKIPSAAAVLWDGPEGCARRFLGFCSTFWAIFYIKGKTTDKATLSFILIARQAVRFFREMMV